MKHAADHFVPVGQELGGKSANIAFFDANLDAVLLWALPAIFTCSGPICVAGSRLGSSRFSEWKTPPISAGSRVWMSCSWGWGSVPVDGLHGAIRRPWIARQRSQRVDPDRRQWHNCSDACGIRRRGETLDRARGEDSELSRRHFCHERGAGTYRVNKLRVTRKAGGGKRDVPVPPRIFRYPF